ncbi:MAG: ankyrin repeat domain-containing protein [Myxococcales bacterium]|nr:ankyrin repeat domain-containing protein [Myxococcales bacterium]
MSLFEAASAGDLAEARRLLSEGADVNELGEGGRTPLIEAARAGREELVRTLLEAGAEASLTDEMEETALLKAAANGHRGTVELLIPHAREDERSLARAFLQAAGKELGPVDSVREQGLERKLAKVGAKASKVLGYEEPSKRLERIERAEKRRK